jgi:hypothetical protein
VKHSRTHGVEIGDEKRLNGRRHEDRRGFVDAPPRAVSGDWWERDLLGRMGADGA